MRAILGLLLIPALCAADIIVPLPPDVTRIDQTLTSTVGGVGWKAESAPLDNGVGGVWYVGFTVPVTQFALTVGFDSTTAGYCHCTPYINIGLNSAPYSPHLDNGYVVSGFNISASGTVFGQSSMWIYYNGKTGFGGGPPSLSFNSLTDPTGVPEPSTLLLTALGLLGSGLVQQWWSQSSRQE